MSDSEIQEGGGYRNPIKGLGYANIFNVMIVDPEISDGAFRLYSLYLRFAGKNTNHWWGMEKIANVFKCSVRTISTWNAELEKAGYITRERQYGHTSYTWIEEVSSNPRLKALALSKPFVAHLKPKAHKPAPSIMQDSAQLVKQDSAPSIMQDSARISTTHLSTKALELSTREKTRVVGPPTAVDNPSSLSGEAEPTSTQDQLQKKGQRVLKREIMPSSAVHDHPGLVWTQDEDLLHVVDVNVEPEDTVITCPDCEEDQPWPRSQGQRRKEPALICHECGAYFRVHTEHNGRGKTYQLPIVGQEGRWMAHIDDVPYRVNSFPCTQAQAERLTRLWLEDAGTVRSLLVWIDKENLIQRAWRNHRDRIAGAVITGFKSRKQNSEGRKAAEQIHEEITTADSDVSALFEETK